MSDHTLETGLKFKYQIKELGGSFVSEQIKKKRGGEGGKEVKALKIPQQTTGCVKKIW